MLVSSAPKIKEFKVCSDGKKVYETQIFNPLIHLGAGDGFSDYFLVGLRIAVESSGRTLSRGSAFPAFPME